MEKRRGFGVLQKIPGNSAEETGIVDEQELLGVSACILIRLVLVALLDGRPLEELSRVNTSSVR